MQTLEEKTCLVTAGGRGIGRAIALAGRPPGTVAVLLAGGDCPAPPGCCPGDFNSDGIVDGDDIPGFITKLFSGDPCP